MTRSVLGFAMILLACVGCETGKETLKREGGGSATRTTLPEPRTGSLPSAWSNSSEYRNSNGLALMRAAEGYAARTTGQPGGRGKTVAVLDTPLDVDHDDLLAQGITTERFDFELDNPDFRDPNIVHGTHVAGTVAARRNGHGVHGVAYNANLKGLSVLRAVQPTRLHPFPVIESSSDVAAGIASAAGLRQSYDVYDALGRLIPTGNPFQPFQQKVSNRAAESDVFNMSLGTPDNQGQVLSAMRDAAREDKIMVAALGNCGRASRNHGQCNYFGDFDGHGPSSAPARYMTSPGVTGNGIAVGALDQSGRGVASFSNTCGEVARYCLFAPGSGIQSTVPQGRFNSLSGTSMASPHVAGAAAVVWAAFPNKSASQIVRRLLDTARPLDRFAISSTFGHGALDLEAALRPSGSFSMTVPGGGMVLVANTVLQVPPGFDVPSGSMNLSDTIVYDDQKFPFLYDLGGHFQESGAGTANSFAQWFLSSLDAESTSLSMGPNAVVHFAHGESDPLLAVGPDRSQDEHERVLSGMVAQFSPVSDIDLSVGNLTQAVGSSNNFLASRTRQTLFPEDMSVSPFAAIAGSGFGVNADWRWDENTVIDVVGLRGTGYFGSTVTHLTSIGVTRRIGEDMSVGARYGALRENGSRMGIRTKGALGNISKTTTHFVDVSVNGRLTEQVTVFGGMSLGVADASSPGQGSLVTKWGTVRGESFTLGSEVNRLWTGSDQLVLTASLPFRARDAEVTINLPNEEIEDQVLHYSPRRIGLAPQGRETRLQLMYELGITQGVTVTAGGYTRIQPDHDANAETEFGVAGKIRVSF